jgi:hypothetical protein
MPSVNTCPAAVILESESGGDFPPEFALLLACSTLRTDGTRQAEISRLSESGLDWPRVLELGEHHGVLPLVHQALEETKAQVPPEVRLALDARCEENVRRSLRFTAELFRVLDCLQSAGVPAMPYKGPVLAQIAYGDLARRDFSDLDVLVPREEVLRAKEALRSLGYAPAARFSAAEERAYLATGYEYTFDGPAGANLLEIQWDIVPRFYSVDFRMHEFFTRAVEVELAGRRVKSLAPEDLLLALCVHAAKHAWIRLCWLRDIAGVTSALTIDWDAMGRRAGRLGIRRILGVSLALAQRLLGADMAPAMRACLAADPQVRRLCAQIIGRIPAGECNTESPDYFRLMLRLRERVLDQMHFAMRLAFTPSVGEWKLVRLPAPLFPLYRGIRLFRLAKKLRRARSDRSE